MRLQWRRFTFFEKSVAVENVSSRLGQVSCVCAGMRSEALSDSCVFVGDSDGHVTTCAAAEDEQGGAGLEVRHRRRVLRGWAMQMSFASHEGECYLALAGDDTPAPAAPEPDLKPAPAPAGAAAAGADADADPPAPTYALKVFRVGFGSDEGGGSWGALEEVQSVSLPPELRAFDLTALALSAGPDAAVAMGFSDGTVLALSGVDLSGRAPCAGDALWCLKQAGPLPVSSLHFAGAAEDGAPARKLFVVCGEDGLVYRSAVGAKGHESGEDPRAVGGGGIATFAVDGARRSASSVLLDERGCGSGCADINGLTSELVVGRSDGVFFFSTEDRGGAAGFEGEKQWVQCLGGYILVASLESRSQRTGISVYDLHNKFVAFHMLLPLGQRVTRVASTGSTAWVLTSGQQLLRLREKATEAKLELLLRKNLFPIAISLASEASYDPGAIVDIYRKYGDHLYKKCDFEGAMAQYVQTIGHVDTSYVILKFLTTQRIALLTVYLEKMHELGHALAEHTNLLLSCYTKLRDAKKLEAFVNGDGAGLLRLDPASGGAAGEGGAFDVRCAIQMLSDSGYHDYATCLAKRSGAHEEYVKVQLSRADPKHGDALEYMSTLPPALALEFLQKHGRALLRSCAKETTGLLMHLCGSAEAAAHVDAMIPLFADHPEWLRLFLEHVGERVERKPGSLCNPLLELYLARWQRLPGEDAASKEQRRAWSRKIMALLEDPRCEYDADHALVLTQMAKFRPGQLLLLERRRLTELVLQAHADEGDLAAQLKLCRRAGRGRPDLWARALRYAVQATLAGGGAEGRAKSEWEDEDDRWDAVVELLQLCEQQDVLPPLQVLDILAMNPAMPLHIVGPFVERLLAAASGRAEADRLESRELRFAAEEMRAEIEDLRGKPKVFQATKCAASGNPLELPGVHFLCGHSFNLSSLPEGEMECLLCSGDHRKWLEIGRSQLQAASDHEQFFKELEQAHSGRTGFDVVAKYFGHGVIN